MKYCRFLCVVFCCCSVLAQAHFIVETQNREIHVLPAAQGDTRVILRFPLTLAYANELARRAPGAAFSAPFMRTEMVQGAMYYRLDSAAALGDHDGFADFLMRDFGFSVQGNPVHPIKTEFVVIDTHANAESSRQIESGLRASAALLLPGVGSFPERPYISDALVVMSVILPEVGPADPLKIVLSSAPFAVPEGKYFETHITDHRQATARLLTFAGASFKPVTLAGSPVDSFKHFVTQGVHHIFTGVDHVLFVVCLVIAAANLRILLLSVTGFTLGHSITLAAGILGFTPQASWFIPLVECLVAISILLMGSLILLRRTGRQGFGLAGLIGLLHGFGFAFMLAGRLNEGGTALAIVLAGFNIGIELGQLVIVLVTAVLLRLAAAQTQWFSQWLRYGVAASACAIALFMIFRRSEALLQTIEPG